MISRLRFITPGNVNSFTKLYYLFCPYIFLAPIFSNAKLHAVDGHVNVRPVSTKRAWAAVHKCSLLFFFCSNAVIPRLHSHRTRVAIEIAFVLVCVWLRAIEWEFAIVYECATHKIRSTLSLSILFIPFPVFYGRRKIQISIEMGRMPAKVNSFPLPEKKNNFFYHSIEPFHLDFDSNS